MNGKYVAYYTTYVLSEVKAELMHQFRFGVSNWACLTANSWTFFSDPHYHYKAHTKSHSATAVKTNQGQFEAPHQSIGWHLYSKASLSHITILSPDFLH